MKILVIGAGVLGSLYAARLQAAGHDVSIMARGERLEQIRARGILLQEHGSENGFCHAGARHRDARPARGL